MKKLAALVFSCTVILLLPSCAPQEVSKDNTASKDSTYVFDQIPIDTVKKIEVPPVETPVIQGAQFIVQMGAFSTMDKAEFFTSAAKKKLTHNFVINYNQEKKLYMVQINPPYSSRAEAEQVRDNIRQYQEYKDAWILTVNK